jgi:hypothetical protein
MWRDFCSGYHKPAIPEVLGQFVNNVPGYNRAVSFARTRDLRPNRLTASFVTQNEQQTLGLHLVVCPPAATR